MKEIVETLTKENKTISFMESCTGGFLASELTNIEGASEVLKVSLVTYSNEFKIKFGVNKNVIDKYSVYSEEVAKEMAYNVSMFSGSDYGVGVTGKFNRIDKRNNFGKDNEVFLSIYNKNTKEYFNKKVELKEKGRLLNKKEILNSFIELMKEQL